MQSAYGRSQGLRWVPPTASPWSIACLASPTPPSQTYCKSSAPGCYATSSVAMWSRTTRGRPASSPTTSPSENRRSPSSPPPPSRASRPPAPSSAATARHRLAGFRWPQARAPLVPPGRWILSPCCDPRRRRRRCRQVQPSSLRPSPAHRRRARHPHRGWARRHPTEETLQGWHGQRRDGSLVPGFAPRGCGPSAQVPLDSLRRDSRRCREMAALGGSAATARAGRHARGGRRLPLPAHGQGPTPIQLPVRFTIVSSGPTTT